MDKLILLLCLFVSSWSFSAQAKDAKPCPEIMVSHPSPGMILFEACQDNICRVLGEGAYRLEDLQAFIGGRAPADPGWHHRPMDLRLALFMEALIFVPIAMRGHSPWIPIVPGTVAAGLGFRLFWPMIRSRTDRNQINDVLTAPRTARREAASFVKRLDRALWRMTKNQICADTLRTGEAQEFDLKPCAAQDELLCP